MPQILVDESTLFGLQAAAKATRLSIDEYLRRLARPEGNGNLPAFSVADFERELDELVSDGPTLPRDFSRADIYAERD